MLETLITQKVVNTLPVVDENTLFYTDFSLNARSGYIYEAARKEYIASSIPLTTANPVPGFEGEATGRFAGAVNLRFSIPRAIGTKDYTLETVVRIATADKASVMIMLTNIANAAGLTGRVSLGKDTQGNIYAVTASGVTRATGVAAPLDRWFNLTTMRKNGVTRVYIDGVNIYAFNYPDSVNETTFSLGSYLGSASLQYFKGQMAAAQISDICRYNFDGFTPSYPIFPI